MTSPGDSGGKPGNGGGRPSPDDPYELNPFEGGDYDPSLAFAYVAARQAEEHLDHAQRFFDHASATYGDHANAVSRSAMQSSQIRLADLGDLHRAVLQSKEAAVLADRGSPEFRQAVDDTVDRFNELKGLYDTLTHTVAQIATADPQLGSSMPQAVDPNTLLAPHSASLKVHADLDRWVDQHLGTDEGRLSVVNATPGIGKTHAMIRRAYQEHMNKQRVAFAVRVKSMIVGDDSEMTQRVHRMSPTGKVSLVVIVGRDETNCRKFETVAAVQDHGYAPGQSVCFQCEHYPDNASIFGLGICGYYEERIRAHNLARGARRGWHRQYPLVLTTQASLIVATSSTSSGGRWNAYWDADLVFVDEDPTDAMEVDIITGTAQCKFRSQSPQTRAAGVAASLFDTAIGLAAQQRKEVESNQFRASESSAPNTHPLHSRYDSQYTGADLQALLEAARMVLALNTSTQLPPPAGVYAAVVEGSGFHVAPGALAQISSTDDINALDIPPKSLNVLCDALFEEINHTGALRRIVYERITGHPATGPDAETEIQRHTDVSPSSYIVRLECLPQDLGKGRRHDEWRFVVRDFRPFGNRTAALVIGDAYAQPAHYEHLFQRPVDPINVAASLHPAAHITRILDSNCNISELRNGGLQRVLALVEAQMHESVKPGDRVLVYGHNDLRSMAEPWLEDVARRLEFGGFAYEHWWGGRGKDEYNGWEHIFTLSDPIQSLSGIKHVVNARAFRDSVRAKTPEDKLLHGARVELGDDKRGPVYALRKSHPRIALEHDRMNVAELTQAMHRSRPVYHPSKIWLYGEMEQSPDLIAQVDTRVGPGSRILTTAKSRSTQSIVSVTSFITDEEADAAIRAIIDHYGVYSSWFAHALVYVPNDEIRLDGAHGGTTVQNLGGTERSPVSGPVFQNGNDSGDLQTYRYLYDPVVSCEGSYRPQDHTYISTLTPTPEPPDGGGGKVPRNGSGAGPDVDGGATEPAPSASMAVLPNPRSIIERVWHPPVYWKALGSSRSQPFAIERAHARLGGLAKTGELVCHKSPKRPAWDENGRGAMPALYFDPRLVRVDVALKLYYEIINRQYGLSYKGRMDRPNAVMEIPCSLSTIPF